MPQSQSQLPFGDREPILVRVGVPAGEVLVEALAEGARSAMVERTSRWSRYVPSLANMESSVAVGDATFTNVVNKDYVLDPIEKVAFEHATSDLTEPAKRALAQLLAQGKRLTVADVHQRRPPTLAKAIGLHPDPTLRENFWRASLRTATGSDSLRSKKQAWKGGCVAETTRGINTPMALDTFDSFAKHHAEAWYMTDFSKAGPATMRPVSRGVTRFALNIPTMVLKNANREAAMTKMRLL